MNNHLRRILYHPTPEEVNRATDAVSFAGAEEDAPTVEPPMPDFAPIFVAPGQLDLGQHAAEVHRIRTLFTGVITQHEDNPPGTSPDDIDTRQQLRRPVRDQIVNGNRVLQAAYDHREQDPNSLTNQERDSIQIVNLLHGLPAHHHSENLTYFSAFVLLNHGLRLQVPNGAGMAQLTCFREPNPVRIVQRENFQHYRVDHTVNESLCSFLGEYQGQTNINTRKNCLRESLQVVAFYAMRVVIPTRATLFENQLRAVLPYNSALSLFGFKGDRTCYWLEQIALPIDATLTGPLLPWQSVYLFLSVAVKHYQDRIQHMIETNPRGTGGGFNRFNMNQDVQAWVWHVGCLTKYHEHLLQINEPELVQAVENRIDALRRYYDIQPALIAAGTNAAPVMVTPNAAPPPRVTLRLCSVLPQHQFLAQAESVLHLLSQHNMVVALELTQGATVITHDMLMAIGYQQQGTANIRHHPVIGNWYAGNTLLGSPTSHLEQSGPNNEYPYMCYQYPEVANAIVLSAYNQIDSLSCDGFLKNTSTQFDIHFPVT